MSLPCISHHVPVEGLWGLPIRPFGLLVATGVMIGYSLGRRRARAIGLDPEICGNGMFWTVVAGFVVAHWFSVLFYFPEELNRDPFVLLKFWDKLSSFGGFLGGTLGALFFFRRHRASLLKYADAIIFGLVPGWVFGRLGCTIVHDHPGAATSFFLGVRCGPGGTVVHDLGFYEALFAALLTAVLYGLRRVRPFYGFHVALMLLLYAPVRFGLDFLRVDDRRYFAITPGQYFALASLLGAVAVATIGLRRRNRGQVPPPLGQPDPDLVAARPERKSKSAESRQRRRRSPR